MVNFKEGTLFAGLRKPTEVIVLVVTLLAYGCVKECRKIVWMGLALMASTRLFLAGVVSPPRDRALAKQLMGQVRRTCARSVCALLVCTDGWTAYPNSIRYAFRKTG